MSVQFVVRRFHRSKTPALFFKLDISKAFDSVRWEYLLTLMSKLGFPPKWREWVAALLSTSSSRILLNGVPTAPIKHGRGVRQARFHHCYLLLLSTHCKKILDLATEEDHLVKFKGKQVVMRTSIYADDTAIFVKPYKKDVTALADILTKFGEVSGLKTNVQKSSVIPIRCQGVDLDEVLCDFLARRTLIPTKYFGLPLTITRLRRIDFQPLVDKAVSKLTVWNGKNINHAGRSTLVKTVLTSQSVYCLTSLRAHKATLKEIDNLRKSFLWAGSDKLTGGKCKVNWPCSTRPTESRGLGILYLEKIARAPLLG